MADLADKAAAYQQQEIDAAVTHRKPVGPVAVGRCLWCDEPLSGDRRWCDTECRDEWEATR